MVRDNFESRISTGEFSTGRTTSRTYNFGSQTVFRLQVFVVQLEFHPQPHFRFGWRITGWTFGDLPNTRMEKDVVPKILAVDKAVFAFGIDECDLP